MQASNIDTTTLLLQYSSPHFVTSKKKKKKLQIYKYCVSNTSHTTFFTNTTPPIFLNEDHVCAICILIMLVFTTAYPNRLLT